MAIDPDVLAQLPPTLATLFRRAWTGRFARFALHPAAAIALVALLVIADNPRIHMTRYLIGAVVVLTVLRRLRRRAVPRVAVASVLAEEPRRVATYRIPREGKRGDIRVTLDDGTVADIPYRTQNERDRAIAELRAIAPEDRPPRARPKAKRRRRDRR